MGNQAMGTLARHLFSIFSPGIKLQDRQRNVQKLHFTAGEDITGNFVKRFGNTVSMKGAFVLKEHMILTHFYHWNNSTFEERSSLRLA